MTERLGGRLLLAGVVGVLLLAVWPVVSGVWIAFLQSAAFAVSGGEAVLGPPTASPTLAAVMVALLVLPLPLATRLRFVAVTALAALAAEFTVVVLGAALSLPDALMPVLAGLAQDVVPAVGLLIAFARGAGRRR